MITMTPDGATRVDSLGGLLEGLEGLPDPDGLGIPRHPEETRALWLA